jgi:hypothetical protein
MGSSIHMQVLCSIVSKEAFRNLSLIYYGTSMLFQEDRNFNEGCIKLSVFSTPWKGRGGACLQSELFGKWK